jgi:hypothetical protein
LGPTVEISLTITPYKNTMPVAMIVIIYLNNIDKKTLIYKSAAK